MLPRLLQKPSRTSSNCARTMPLNDLPSPSDRAGWLTVLWLTVLVSTRPLTLASSGLCPSLVLLSQWRRPLVTMKIPPRTFAAQLSSVDRSLRYVRQYLELFSKITRNVRRPTFFCRWWKFLFYKTKNWFETIIILTSFVLVEEINSIICFTGNRQQAEVCFRRWNQDLGHQDHR